MSKTLSFLSSIDKIAINKGYGGYINTNADNGYATLSVNKCSGGIEVKIYHLNVLDTSVKEVLGLDAKDAYAKPSVSKAYWGRVKAILEDKAIAEELHIKVVNAAEALERLEEALENLE